MATRVTGFWKRVTYGWSWYDFVVGGVLFGLTGYAIGRVNYFRWSGPESLEFVKFWLTMGIKLWAVFMFSGRAWQIARYPRSQKIDWNKITWAAGFYQNFVSLAFLFFALVFVLSLAPEALRLVDLWTGTPGER